MSLFSDNYSFDGDTINVIVVIESTDGVNTQNLALTDSYQFEFLITYQAVYCTPLMNLVGIDAHYIFRVGVDPDLKIDLDADANDCKYSVTVSVSPLSAEITHDDTG